MRKRNRFRAVRNLIITWLLLLLIWYSSGCPLPTLEMEMHRSERQMLAAQSHVVWRYQGRQYSDRDILVGLSDDSIHTYSEVGRLTVWPRSVKEPALVVLPERTRYTVQGGSYLAPSFLAVDPPALAERARLTMTISYSDSEGSTMLEDQIYRMEGVGQGGCFFFQLEMKYEPLSGDASEEMYDLQRHEEGALWFFMTGFSPGELAYVPYTLEFFDSAGNLIKPVSNHSCNRPGA